MKTVLAFVSSVVGSVKNPWVRWAVVFGGAALAAYLHSVGVE